jgi:hypothetical protein
VDEFIVFEPLTQGQIKAIVQLRAQQLVGRVRAQRMDLLLDASAIDYLAAKVGGRGGRTTMCHWGRGAQGGGAEGERGGTTGGVIGRAAWWK